ncbi:hypothetical protein B0T24DRAFT_534534 [Lasiosphaeria ovina]|uniref:Heterokaryon incompatibility domain-containing protein n=1 Tax=Lasiosphaeria ovina TaxID=92902 RepID=A0AAE0JZ12_9PEZI|nr:hypothetical protein B0T24DRAFT_534534 [Lasiosphaeria ovina]
MWQVREILLSSPQGERELVDPTLNPDFLVEDSPDATLFWIDALCINQADEDEKSKQVPRMGDIYNKHTKSLFG